MASPNCRLLAPFVFSLWITATFANTVLAVDVGESLFSRGLNAYVYGHQLVAERYFTRVIERAPDDSRAYYFRALSRLQTGREQEGQADLRAGWACEVGGKGAASLSAALQRATDYDRQFIEEFRQFARADGAAGEQAGFGDASTSSSAAEEHGGRLRREFRLPIASLLEVADTAAMQDLINKRPQLFAPQSELDRRQPVGIAAAAERGGEDPFVDDPIEDSNVRAQPPFESNVDDMQDDDAVSPFDAMVENPFEPADQSTKASGEGATVSTSGGGKIKSGRMPGILGRVLRRMVPLPELSGRIPGAPTGGFGGPAQDAEFDGELDFGSPAATGDDAFSDRAFDEMPMEAGADENPFGSDEDDSFGTDTFDEDELFGSP